jgi:hypothetical protein
MNNACVVDNLGFVLLVSILFYDVMLMTFFIVAIEASRISKPGNHKGRIGSRSIILDTSTDFDDGPAKTSLFRIQTVSLHCIYRLFSSPFTPSIANEAQISIFVSKTTSFNNFNKNLSLNRVCRFPSPQSPLAFTNADNKR